MDQYLSKFIPGKMIDVADGISIDPWLSEELLKKLNASVLDICFKKETPYHYHKNTREVFRFHNLGKVIFDGREFEVEKDNILYVPIGTKHKLIPLFPTLEATLITVPIFDPSDEYIAE